MDLFVKKTASSLVKMTKVLRFDHQASKHVLALYFTSLTVES